MRILRSTLVAKRFDQKVCNLDIAQGNSLQTLSYKSQIKFYHRRFNLVKLTNNICLTYLNHADDKFIDDETCE